MASRYKARRPRRWLKPIIIAALITAAATIIAAFLLKPGGDKPIPPPPGTGRLAGTVAGRSGQPLGNLQVSISGGGQTNTDVQGKFVLNNVPVGYQTLTLTPANGAGKIQQNIYIEPQATTTANILYDAQTGKLGLLSITSPADNSILEVRQEGAKHVATIFGRCEGVSDILGPFEIHVLLKSQTDTQFWVQPSALIDQPNSRWQTDVEVGDAQNKPYDGQYWNIIAVAAEMNSDLSRLLATPNPNLSGPHISSNIVRVAAKIVRSNAR